MDKKEFKYIDIEGISIAYTDKGEGHVMLFIHGFASFSHTWEKLINALPDKFRFITIDLKSFGYSEKICDEKLSLFDQSRILCKFINKMMLEDLTIVSHSLGGAVTLISLFNPDIMKRVKRNVLISCAGFFEELPDFIEALKFTTPANMIGKLNNENLVATLVLEEAFFDNTKIDDSMLQLYGDFLKEENAKECLVESAKQIAIPNARSFCKKIRAIDSPTMIIWGKNDLLTPVRDVTILESDFQKAEVRILPNCGHFPHEEYPQIVAELISDFLNIPYTQSELEEILTSTDSTDKGMDKTEVFPKNFNQLVKIPTNYIRKLKMRRLVDRWSFGTLIIILFVKFLQLLKKIGFRARKNGWRKVTGIFLRNEHSKFMLAGFRYNYLGNSEVGDINSSKVFLIKRLYAFIKNEPIFHWAVKIEYFQIGRKRLKYIDIIEAEFNSEGELVKIVPHLDSETPKEELPDDSIIEGAVSEFISVFNQFRDLSDKKRPKAIQKKLHKWACRQMRWSYTGPQRVSQFVERLLCGTLIQFEILPDSEDLLTKNRMITPNLKDRKHPGLGLLNIVCRFTIDLKEADLWVQHHHVPVDGVPMQEMLRELKKEWGEVGPVLYPSLKDNPKPEIFFAGNGIFRARIFANFDKFLKLRKYLNEKFYTEMGGSATVSSMMIWGLAQSNYFKQSKFVFPVDTALVNTSELDRNISLIFIRPNEFKNKENPLSGFLKYQKEFNQRVFATRLGRSESYELLELYAMIHPMFYQIARKFMSKATEELVGAAGLTIIRDAEMFISPLTDLQSKGFVALGNLRMETEDGDKAGAVSICGSKTEVFEYIKAIENLLEHLAEYLNIDPKYYQ